MSSEPQVTFSPRPATEEDLPSLVALEREIQVAPWTEEHFREEMAKPFSRVILLTDDETDADVAGYLVFWVIGSEAHLLNLGVAPGHRGKGFGKLLVRKCFALVSVQNSEKIRLEVRKSNLAALGLYQGLGFDICQIRKQFYSNGEDAYVMEARVEGGLIDF
jgi:ribosomal-protein-alanine N-acetyltransferase